MCGIGTDNFQGEEFLERQLQTGATFCFIRQEGVVICGLSFSSVCDNPIGLEDCYDARILLCFDFFSRF